MLGGLKDIALNGVLIAVVAHGLIGISLVWDKVLLQRKGTQNLFAYVFWLGVISVFGLALIPFGFRLPGWRIAAIGFGAGVLDLIASYFYYDALKTGEASDELAAMGGFAPVATAVFSIPLLQSAFGGDFLGFTLMTVGGFAMFFAEKRPVKEMLPKILLASFCFGMTNVMQKITFNSSGFVTGYVFFTLGTTAGSLALLIPSSWRRQIFETSEHAEPRSRFWYGVNRFIAGLGSFLVVLAVSRATPALVESISGLRYVIIFIGAWWITRFRPSWFSEDFSARTIALKLAGTALVLAGLVLVGMHRGTGQSTPG
jgi:uncharacterized membrane protein